MTKFGGVNGACIFIATDVFFSFSTKMAAIFLFNWYNKILKINEIDCRNYLKNMDTI